MTEDVVMEEVEQTTPSILLRLRNAIGDEDTTKDILSNADFLHENPDSVLLALVPCLFTPSTLKTNEALQILSYLVAWNAELYLKPASRSVKQTLLDQLLQPDESFEIPTEVLRVLVDQLINSHDVEVSENAMESVAAACKLSNATFVATALDLLQESLVSATSDLKTNKVLASTKCVRCLTTAVNIACLNDCATKSSQDSLDILLSLLQDDSDPLLQVTILDLVEKLASEEPMNEERARWCLDRATSPLLVLAGGGNDDREADPIMGGPSLRTLASICHLAVSSNTSSSAVAPLLHLFHGALLKFEASNSDDRLVQVDAISSFASISSNTMDMVLQDRVTRDAWLYLGVQPALKSAVLVSVAQALKNESQGCLLLTAIATVNDRTDATELITSLLPQNPGAYTLLEAVIRHMPGPTTRRILSQPNFLPMLLQRDGTKEGREAKHTIVKAILASPVKDFLVEEVVTDLQELADNGPHYRKPVRWDVAEQ